MSSSPTPAFEPGGADRAPLSRSRTEIPAHHLQTRQATTAPLPPPTYARDLPGWQHIGTALRRTPASVWNDNVTDFAAALTYYAVLALFPTFLVTVSLLGIVGASTTDNLIANVIAVVPAESRPVMQSALQGMAEQHTAAWMLAVFGMIGALWSASSYLGVFRRALHVMHGVEDLRPAWRTAPRLVMTAVVLLMLLVSSALVLILTGEAAHTVGRLVGMGSMAGTAWNALKWPLLLCLVAIMVLVLFRSGPAGTRGVRQRLVGDALAVALWLVASAGFALYVSHVGTYNRLYGSLAGIIVFLVWLWLSNLALLTGAQFNAELAKLRRR
ncbi:YihY/virulence factor BrkB family protein [Streptomyces sp. DH24]|uniref:YihY/virulence factor BrkB family protein n=1 Tax=Streptomyces sp. DH24 TaxID=3040123 RepID=UPI0024410FC2|nr:YihY/virulence factor BrkB family protein [Streptomyces sp. DH24]MDG9720461.1 YihY/virulence factor BrkB family protein [Streptomyces sp. DH24]